MAVTVTEPQSKKRKQPPTFQYLPRDRAQKLKKVWIEKKKLRSKWKAQKLKEGLDSGWSGRAILKGQNEDEAAQREDEDESGSKTEHEALPSSEDESERSEPPRVSKTRVEMEAQRPHSSANSKGKQPQKRKPTIDEERDSQTAPSLRDRTRLAYSPSSLHTHKADPLHRRKGAFPSSNNNNNKFDRQRGGKASGDGGNFGRNMRGQPNMKLRMEAMLERIKKDYS